MHTFLDYGGLGITAQRSVAAVQRGAVAAWRGGSNTAVRQGMRLAGWGWTHPPAVPTPAPLPATHARRVVKRLSWLRLSPRRP
ncbi:hypothetical protein [Corynebacterium matruchotii]|uniref:hypothetical protein n=1 Tax=Corynebacterium matruchotii TaxID=43768 RepID=UPI0028EC5B74|nr:hypothetical protein [Corynebacterium matruchotii]